jgi:cell division protein FtsQ
VNTGKAIRKFLFISVWLMIGGGMVTLLLAAIGKQKKDQCRDYSIIIKTAKQNLFVDEKNVQQLLMAGTGGKIKGQQLSSINLHQLEQLLEDNHWIKDAELYFDNRDVLHITVTEREPIARIFTIEGSSYYIDSSGQRMPLSDKMSARVPVFTGMPEMKRPTKKDDILFGEVKTAAQFIINDPFWMAQVSQIDITPGPSTSSGWNFEMIPVVGNHLVKLGDGENIAQKFHRLFVFYNEVLSKAGFEKYKTIDVQYAGQVIGVKGNSNSKIDLAQLRTNINKLLQQAKQNENDTIAATKMIIEKPTIQIDSLTAEKKKVTKPVEKIIDRPSSPNPVKSFLKPEEKKVPKAVMQKKVSGE